MSRFAQHRWKKLTTGLASVEANPLRAAEQCSVGRDCERQTYHAAARGYRSFAGVLTVDVSSSSCRAAGECSNPLVSSRSSATKIVVVTCAYDLR